MDYLTNYYKNLSEQLQEKINYLSKLIESQSEYIVPPKKKGPINWGDPRPHQIPELDKYPKFPSEKPTKKPNWDGSHDEEQPEIPVDRYPKYPGEDPNKKPKKPVKGPFSDPHEF